MNKTPFRVGFFTLTVLIGMCAYSSKALSQIGITVIPENPTEIDSLEITINAETLTHPAWIVSTSCEVTEGLMKIFADVGCGYFYAISPYMFTVTVPPVAADTYEIQYWTTEDCHIESNPILTSEVVVSLAPIATRSTTWGAIKALLR